MYKYLLTTAMMAAVTPVAAHAQNEERQIAFDIAAGDTANALNAFARQAEVHVSFPYDAIAGRKVQAMRGRFTRREALRRLISGQGLVVASESATLISLKAAPERAIPIAGGEPQSEIVVRSGSVCLNSL
ncbi:STN domain-containing protein [Novosphingobium sp. BW1]|uniref:STN domain-containing protein n=1 Tax=Novosphingobium sp. BW1 TaxID=2592621 RepID=UPI0011DE6B08|nr:STN domain-containing protein [Novosphingobium sp. BW1]TYC89235.1 hypothetical protein FMM79_11055 [Novosphingobium sp. BW1]